MIVPFVYNLETVSDYEHISVFYFYLTMVKHTEGALIAHERYFLDIEKLYENILNKEQLQATAEFLEFDMPEQKDLAKIGKYMILQKFEDEMISNFSSRMDCWTYLLKENYKPFSDRINHIFDEIEKDYAEKIEAVLCFYEPLALRYAAENRGIRVIHQEGTMFRKPFYRMAGYFDFKEGYGRGELEERYYRFQEEAENKNIKYFSEKEICALFMTGQGLSQIHLMDAAPQYELGIGVTDFSLGVNLKDTLINMEEIFLEARKNYATDQIIMRSRYQVTECEDDSPSAFHFILKCKRVAALHSNLSFETMLLRRTACIYGTSPYAFMGNRGICDKKDRKIPIDFINFTVFGYFVPWELLRDSEYIRWRLSNPAEVEIYERHMEYYLQQRGLQASEVFSQKQEERLEFILNSQNVQADEAWIVNREMPLAKVYQVLQKEHADLSNSYEKLLDEYIKLQKEHAGLSDCYEQLSSQYVQLQEEHVRLSDDYERICKES